MEQYDFNAISQVILPHLEDILLQFNIKYTSHWNRLSMKCPIHEGNKEDALCIFIKPSYKGLLGNWICYTNGCQNEWGRHLIGFIRALLSSKKKKTIKETIDWCRKYLDGDPLEYSVDLDKQNFIRLTNTLNYYNKYKFQIDRSFFRSRIIIPPEYYLNKGYSKYILDKYDVGVCNDPSKPFYKRFLVPLYDQKHSNIVAVLARSPYNKCSICNEFHEGECKTSPKWLNSGFTGGILYNYWFSKNHIRNKGECIIVEGCGDVWKLEQSGIYNSVALCTNNITYAQQVILEKSGATKLILALDSDEKGQEGKEKIKRKLGRYYNIDELKLPKKDFGEMTEEEIKSIFKK